MTRRYDAVVIGGGHNGLVCAFYLARAGLSVRVLERRPVVGGAAVTEEFAPGFRNSTASYTVSLLQPKVIRDMRLHERGLRIVEREAANFVPFDDDYLLLGERRSRGEIARLSPADAAALPEYEAALERIADVLRDMALRAPPGIGAKSWLSALAGGRGAARLPLAARRDLLALFARSAREFLDGWFVDDRVKAAFAFDAVVGNYAAPSTPGSAYVLLHHVFGEVNGRKGAWGHAIGGMGAITQAMAAACRDAGVEISLEAPVARVLVEPAPAKAGGGRAVGVALESGEEIAATVVAANVGPALLYRRMVARHELPPDFARRIDGYACGSGTLRMNVALSELPSFAVLPGKARAAHHTAGIVLAPGMEYMERAFDDAKAHGWSRAPIVELLIPSTLDDTLAPAGAHVASLFCQQFAPVLPDGRAWADEREAAADAAVAVVERFAPGFTKSIVARQVHTPADLEAKFGLVGGDIFHGRMSLDQLWAARPVLGHGDYRGAVRGLYHCGAGAHPGGGVTGAPGHNAARAVLADRGWFGRVMG